MLTKIAGINGGNGEAEKNKNSDIFKHCLHDNSVCAQGKQGAAKHSVGHVSWVGLTLA